MADVVVTDYTFPNLDQERAAAEELGFSFAAHQCRSAEEVERVLQGAKVGVVQFAPVSSDAIKGMDGGAALVRYGIGFDNIDLPAANTHNIPVGYVPDYCVEEVAEHTCTLMLTQLRKVFEFDVSVRAGRWEAVSIAAPMKAFANVKVGFFGFGQIGRAVHERLKAFGFKFCVADPALSDVQARELGVEKVDAATLFAVADAITLHAPVTPETKHFVDANVLANMQSHAVLVNTSRGALIDECALADALNGRQIAGAALDVFGVEPLPETSELRAARGVILSPHAAWYSEDAIGKLQSLVADDIRAHLSGQALRKPVPGSTACEGN
jgi:D-3-phosphoglycerate dehydrogenase